MSAKIHEAVYIHTRPNRTLHAQLQVGCFALIGGSKRSSFGTRTIHILYLLGYTEGICTMHEYLTQNINKINY